MPEFSIPGVNRNTSHEQLLEVVARSNETFEWLLNTLAKNKVLNMDELDINDLSVPDGKIVDINGSKAWALSVGNAKIATGLDGAKMLSLSVADAAIAALNGAKLNALSAPWSSIGNSRITGTMSGIVVPINSGVFGTVDHSASKLYKFAGPPMIKATGSTELWSFSVSNSYWSTVYGGEIYPQIAYYSEGGFCYYFFNKSTTTAYTISVDWYRDGIYL